MFVSILTEKRIWNVK